MQADIEALNDQQLSPLTLASKLGRFQLFNEIIQLQSCVSSQHCIYLSTAELTGPGNEPSTATNVVVGDGVLVVTGFSEY